MINDVFLERVAHFVHKIHVDVCVSWVDLSPPFVNRHENRLNAARCLRHEARCTSGCDGQAGDVSPSVCHHVLIEGRVCLFDSQDERIVFLPFGVIDFKGSSLLSHIDRRGVCSQSECALHLHGEVRGLLRAISEAHGGNHVAFGSNAHSRAPSHAALAVYLLPEVVLSPFHLLALRVALYLFQDVHNFL